MNYFYFNFRSLFKGINPHVNLKISLGLILEPTNEKSLKIFILIIILFLFLNDIFKVINLHFDLWVNLKSISNLNK